MLQPPPPENSVTVCNQTEPETEQDAETTRRWQTYLHLDPQLAHLPPETLRIREANFRRMKPAAQQSLIRPLQQHLQDVKNYPQRLARAS
jgi:hypothetical protein